LTLREFREEPNYQIDKYRDVGSLGIDIDAGGAKKTAPKGAVFYGELPRWVVTRDCGVR
jgi:hypothetical protein